MSGYGDKLFGLHDIKLTNLLGTVQVDLPVAMVLKFNEKLVTGELRGDDALMSAMSILEGLDWELGAGGISLEAYALMTGRTVTLSGTTPTRTTKLTARAGESYPYFKIYGKSLGDGIDDIHIKIFKAKITKGIDGTLKNGEYLTTGVSGMAIDDGVNGIWEPVQNETAATLPTT